jgi:hypothetical protein
MHLEGFQVVSSQFRAFVGLSWSPAWPVVVTDLTGVRLAYLDVGNQSDRCSGPVRLVRAKLVQLLCFMKWLACTYPGGVALVQVELACMCAGGGLGVFRALLWWSLLFVWSCFYLGCVEPLPLPKGTETCLPQVILILTFLWLPIACWIFLFVSFLFLFSYGYHVCVVNALIKGEIESLCGSRTGGWSLPSVMSD